MVIKAEVVQLAGRQPRDNPRFVVTNLRQTPRFLYEKVYCGRGDIENRIKELHDGLQIDRTSCHSFWPFAVQITPIRRASSRQFSNCPGNRDHFIGESFVQSTVQPVSQTATALLAGIVLAVAVPVAAQPLTSRVEGTVQDETGAVIPGASVTMTRVDTGVAQETAADERGLYLFPLVPAGTYTVQAGAAGFTTTEIEGVRVALNAPTSIDVVLEVGAVSETVVVAAAGPQSLLNTANAELSTNLSREQVRDLGLFAGGGEILR